MMSLAALKVTCGSHADLDLVASRFLQFKEIIECYNTIDFG